MKKIYAFILVAASLAVAACQPKELDDKTPVDVNPTVKSIKISATIEDYSDTKVTYDISDAGIKPTWAVGDILFGFDENGVTFTYEVTDFDEDEATIVTTGSSYNPAEGTKVYGIYYPGKGVEDIKGSTGEESLAIDLAGQSGTLASLSPAIMCATATVENGEIRFKFINQTAIVGLKKIQVGSGENLKANTKVNQIAIEGVVTHGKLSVVDGELVLTPGTKASTVYAVPGASSTWITNDAGQIDFGATSPIAFAVLPKAGTTPVVYAYTDGAAFKNNASIGEKEIEAGNYYYMSKKLDASAEPVASLTVGGVTSQYYSVSDAFDAADCSNEDCTVKLLNDCSTTRNPQIRGTNGSGDITIDLNGKTLTMSHQFGVYDSNITICDSSSVVLANQGKITSAVSTVASYFFSGSSLTLEGGTLENTANQIALYLTSSSSAVLKGGCVKSDENRAIYVNACSLSVPANSTVQVAAKNHSIYSANGTANIAGGHFDSGNGGSAAITSAGSSSEVTITGGYFSTEHTVILGVSNSGKFYVSDGSFSAPLSTARAVDKEQNLYNNTLNTEASTKAKYPFTLSDPGTYAALVSSGSTNYQCDGIECAIKAADVNAKATGISNISLNTNCAATAAMAISSGNTYGVTLDLNGHTVSATGVSPLITTASDFTLTDSSEGGAGELNTTGDVALSVTAGTTTINSGSLVGAVNAATVSADATLTVNNGYFYGAENDVDIDGAEGTVTLYAGWYRKEPSPDYLATGTAAQSGSESHNERTYYWTIGVESAVVEVNEVGYASLGAAVAAANALDEAETVTIKLLADISYDSQIDLTNAYDKPIVLDLNGHTLSTETESFITTDGNLTITDNGLTKRMITSSASKVLVLTSSSADVTLNGCKIVSTKETGSDYYSDAAILMNNSQAKLTVTGATIYTTRGLTTISNRAGSLTISDSEISSGTESTGLIAVCNGLANASTTINSGSFYTSSTTANRPVVYTGSSASSSSTAGSVTINDGYFYFAGDTRDVRASYSSQNDKITINAGYFAHDLTWTKDPTYGSGKSLQAIDPAETHAHATIGQTLSYGYQVTDTPIVYVAEVNGEPFTSFAEALSTTNAYAEEGDVTLKLLDNVSANTILFDNTSKTIILDLNNYTLTNSASNKYLVRAAEGQTLTVKDGSLSSTDSTAVYCYKGTLTIDNCNITGACTKLIYNYQGTATIQNGTVIKNTLTSSSQAQTATGAVVNYGGTMLVTGSTIESTGTVTALWNGTTGTLTIEGDSEVSVCTDGTSKDGIAICNYANYSKNNAELVINSGSIYTNSPTQTKPAVYQYGALGTTTINGGYFYNANNSAVVVIRANTGANYSKFTVNGGFFNKPLPYVYQSTTYNPTIDANHEYIDITSDPVSHKHNTTDATYQYGYKVVATAGEASVEASTSTPVVVLGTARNNGVNF